MAIFQFRLRKPILFLTVIVLFFSANVVFATTYYVAKTGNDSNSGTESQPWLTIQKAADIAKPGDKISIKPGVYDERVVVSISGSESAYIEFLADGVVESRGFILDDCSYIKIAGFNFTGKISSYQPYIYVKSNARFCTIENNKLSYPFPTGYVYGMKIMGSYCTVKGNTLDGFHYPNIYVSGHHNLFADNTIQNTDHDAMRIFGYEHVIRGNTFQNMYSSGITHVDLFQTFGNNGDVAYNILIENNYFKNCQSQIGNFTQDGVEDIRDWTFRNNLFENIGMQANIYAPGFKFYNNTFYHCDQNTGGPLLFRSSSSRGVAHRGAVINNLFVDCGSRPANTGWYSVADNIVGFQADYNFVTGPQVEGFPSKDGFNEPHGINGGDPKFLSIAASNFRPDKGSPAIDSGTTIDSFSTDFSGTVRPQGSKWDRGAFEVVAQPDSTLTPPAPARLKIVMNTP